MKKAILLLIILTGLVRVTLSQESVALHENLNFQSEAEKKYWNSGEANPFMLFRAVQADNTEAENIWIDLINELDLKASNKKSDIKFVRQIFEKTHQKLLKRYVQNSTFNSMLKDGKFDCVSGSAALSLLLDHYEYTFDIIETDFHVFIIVHLGGQKLILESTAPIGGMMTLPSDIKNYLATFGPKNNSLKGTLNQDSTGFETDFSNTSTFRKVNLKQLAGLQYYNDALVHFNSQGFSEAIDQLSKAYSLYPSDRILALYELTTGLAYKAIGYEARK